jgi:hypothetical protein
MEAKLRDRCKRKRAWYQEQGEDGDQETLYGHNSGYRRPLLKISPCIFSKQHEKKDKETAITR